MSKGPRGGKHSSSGPNKRRPNPDEAGVKREFTPNEAGVKRKFVGSRTKEYTFYAPDGGTITITATSYEDAQRQASARGAVRYKRRD